VAIVVEVGRRKPCIKNQEVVVRKYWGAWDCCYDKRTLGDFSNRGYIYLRKGYFVGVGQFYIALACSVPGKVD